jgi:prepilin-type N-terminal cleavage/methylation domain-containing protein
MIKTSHNKKGFSLLEILLVLMIVGFLFAIILPRAWRARTDASYTLVRQAAVELGNWGMEWTERNLAAQDEAETCTQNDYVSTLVGYTGGKDGGTNNNWFGTTSKPANDCRAAAMTFTVVDIMPEENQPRNPFTGLSYLHASHDGSRTEAGLLYLAMLPDADGFNNYHLLFTGVEPTSATDWHAGMGDGLPPTFAGLRNGVFVARLKP